MKNYVILLNGLPDKKIKSIGNRCLIQITKNKNILDHHIKTINQIFKNPQIILVCGFDSKKLKKYTENKYPNITYIDHPINDYTNIGQSLQVAIEKVKNGNNCLILNTNHILHKSVVQKIKNNTDNSFVLYDKTKGSIGIIYEENKLINCYYDLPNNLYDILYIKNKKNISIDISKLYLFEIINYYIEDGENIKPIRVNNNSIVVINSIKNIEKVKKQLCSI